MNRLLLLLPVFFAAGCSNLPDRVNATKHKVQRELPAIVRGPAQLETGNVFVFGYFINPGGSLHLALSDDGYTWTPACGGRAVFNSPWLGLRDPSLAQGPDGTFHCVFTGGSRTEIGYASSKDLLAWTEPRPLPVMASIPDTEVCWAPEICFDPVAGHWVIAWSSEIPGRFPATDTQAVANHRLYYTTTKDFQTLAAPQLLFDPGYPLIDPAFYYDGTTWRMFYKDERDEPAKKQLRMVSGPSPIGPWSAASDALTVRRVEAPCPLQVGDEVIVYFDEYRRHTYGAIRSADLRSWDDVSKIMSFPKGARHGAFLRVTPEVAAAIRADGK